MADRPNDPATASTGAFENSGIGSNKPSTSQPKAMDAEGTIGKQFTEQGAIGGMAQKMGGPFDKEGAIGKQFTTKGRIGGAVQSSMGGEKKT